MLEEFLTWDMLMTFSGLVIATMMITSFIKHLFDAVPTQIISWLIAFVLLLLANLVTNGFLPWHGWILVLLNSMSVSLTANGAYAVCTRQRKNKDGHG